MFCNFRKSLFINLTRLKLNNIVNKPAANNIKICSTLVQRRHKSELTSVTQDQQDVPEEEYVLSALKQDLALPEVPLMSLNIEKRIDKIEKKGSFTADIFTGTYDDDFLIYPDPLDNRVENKQLKDQAAMIRQLWPQIWDDDMRLQKFNFHNIFQLSVTEMMSIFEAIGASTRACSEDSKLVIQDDETSNKFAAKQLLVTKKIISLITRNCLAYWPIYKSKNERLHGLLPKKHILFGGASVEDSNEPYQPIGFCWSEEAPNLGSLPPQEWSTMGEHGGQDSDFYLIKGKKNNVLYDEKTENFLVFYRDKFLSDKFENEFPVEDANPASDPFTGCVIVHKSELKFGEVYKDSAGFSYTDVEIDSTLPADRLVFPAGRKDPTGVNIKGLGQLATCAVTMGLLKDTLRRIYVYLIESKRGLLSCDIIERKLATITTKIFALESMVYYIAGMYDGLKDGFDAHMEATIMKIVTNDYAYDIIRDLQQILGSDMFILSKLQDQINIFDSFLDGNVYNRLYLSTMGVIWFARSKNMHLNQLRLGPWYPGYFLKSMIKEKSENYNYLKLDADIYGQLHPSLKEAAVNLDYIVKRVKYASEEICMKHGSDVTGAQTSLYQLAQLSIDSFLLTTMLARASKSYCNGSRLSELDVSLATSFSYDLSRKVKLHMLELQSTPFSALFNRSRMINEENIKYGGYYAESPLDPNI